MHVLNMTRLVGIVADDMFPEAPLSDAAGPVISAQKNVGYPRCFPGIWTYCSINSIFGTTHPIEPHTRNVPFSMSGSGRP